LRNGASFNIVYLVIVVIPAMAVKTEAKAYPGIRTLTPFAIMVLGDLKGLIVFLDNILQDVNIDIEDPSWFIPHI
jgi:hypothetical protein